MIRSERERLSVYRPGRALPPLASANEPRRYTVEPCPLYPRFSYTLRRYGSGHWIECNGEPNHFVHEADAHEHGRHWTETGRRLPDRVI